MPKKYVIDLDINEHEANNLLLERVSKERSVSEIGKNASAEIEDYFNSSKDLKGKEQFKRIIREKLFEIWKSSYGSNTALELQNKFHILSTKFEKDGAIIFSGMLDDSKFSEFIEEYDKILERNGNNNILHSYVNLSEFPKFVFNQKINAGFLHPLMLILIAYQIGGPIRAVDIRAKDTGPISILSRDNILHVDNTPFREEYKILLNWEKSKINGPNGQNFTFLPGTHHGVRKIYVSNNQKEVAWSTENEGVFMSEESVQKLFHFQQSNVGFLHPVVVEAHYPLKPLSILFMASALVHHRYRTAVGSPRSCIIVAFHKSQDNPGCLFKQNEALKKINLSYFFNQKERSEVSTFLNILKIYAIEIGLKINELFTMGSSSQVVEQERFILSEKALSDWKAAVTHAPTLEDLKMSNLFFPLKQTISSEIFIDFVIDMISFDKLGHLDLILYSDNHEEMRKQARNMIREMPIDLLKPRLFFWMKDIKQPAKEDILSLKQLDYLSKKMITFIYSDESALNRNALAQSLANLIADLNESLKRVYSADTFLTICLFLFLCCDELYKMEHKRPNYLYIIGLLLVCNYIATSILFEKCKKNNKPSELMNGNKSASLLAFNFFHGEKSNTPSMSVSPAFKIEK